MSVKNSRGIRNNNPGNIRASGTRYRGEVQPSQDDAFKQFETMAWGYRAMFVLLHTYRKRHRLSTISQFIARYAPPTENATTAYASFVGRRAGISLEQAVDTLDREQMIAIVGAMSLIENGVEPTRSELCGGWELFVEHKP